MHHSLPIANQTRHRVAILVDGDNVPHTNSSVLEASVRAWGDITIRRVFGDMTLHKGWANQTSYTVTHCTTSAGKNRADMALVVAALDFAHRGLATAFVIASDDRDFGPLVSHLCEQGFRVDWVGKPKPKAAAVAKKDSKPPALSPLDKKLIEVISSQPDAKDGVTMVKLGQLMEGETVKAQTGKATWRAYLNEKRDLFIVDGKGPDTRVRLPASA